MKFLLQVVYSLELKKEVTCNTLATLIAPAQQQSPEEAAGLTMLAREIKLQA